MTFHRPALDAIGYKLFIIFAILNAAWLPLIYLISPETAGKSLEDVDALFSNTQPTTTIAVPDTPSTKNIKYERGAEHVENNRTHEL